MQHQGKATCKKHGEFKWSFFELENNTAAFGRAVIDKNVKDHDRDKKLVIANCPICGASIVITDYNFDKTN